jgi:hypothetical protein
LILPPQDLDPETVAKIEINTAYFMSESTSIFGRI